MSVIPVSEAATYLGMDGTVPPNLQGRLDTAEAQVARKVGPLEPESTTVRVPGGSTSLVLPVTRPTSLVSITTSTGQAVPLLGLDLDPDAARISGGTFTGRFYVVVVMAGWDPLPVEIREAVLEQTRHLWAPQRGPTGRGRQEQPPPKSGELTARAAELLEPFLGSGFA